MIEEILIDLLDTFNDTYLMKIFFRSSVFEKI